MIDEYIKNVYCYCRTCKLVFPGHRDTIKPEVQRHEGLPQMQGNFLRQGEENRLPDLINHPPRQTPMKYHKANELAGLLLL